MQVCQGRAGLLDHRQQICWLAIWRVTGSCPWRAVQQLKQRAASNILRQDAQGRRLSTDRHQRDDIRMSETTEHSNLIFELSSKFSCYHRVEDLLQGTGCRTPHGMVHRRKAALRYLAANLHFIKQEDGHSVILRRVELSLLEALGKSLDFLLQALDLPLVSVCCAHPYVCIKVGGIRWRATTAAPPSCRWATPSKVTTATPAGRIAASVDSVASIGAHVARQMSACHHVLVMLQPHWARVPAR
mmetsp:Transcript_15066/g.26629  ORF Transcript_15066/g.26629 Transcript_15066/m.26629 type:complete len:244 (+) Transcript_15066:586-1317(+)